MTTAGFGVGFIGIGCIYWQAIRKNDELLQDFLKRNPN